METEEMRSSKTYSLFELRDVVDGRLVRRGVACYTATGIQKNRLGGDDKWVLPD